MKMRHSKKVISAWPFAILMLSYFDQIQAQQRICIRCTDCPEEASGVETTVLCGQNLTPINCAIFINKDGFVQRGCLTDTNFDILIHQCSSNRCNTDRVPICEECSDLEYCKSVPCGKLEDKCYASKSDDRRGCTSDGYYDPELDGFETCETDRCNRVTSCVVCNSAEQSDTNCLDKPEEFITSCLNHGIIKEQNCYRQVDGDQFQLGCTSASDSPVICEGESVPCRKCEADNCNAKAFQRCYVCNNKENCQKDQLLDNSQAQELMCSEYNARCVMGYDYELKTTLRDCSDALPAEALGDIVVPCDTPYCNFAEFPSHLKCYQEKLGEIEFCRSPDATECFTVEDQLENKIRGCNTDEEFAEICKVLENCSVCSSDGCNEDTVPVECVICSGLDQCRNNPQRRLCEDAMFYEGCYTYLGSGSLEKGCLNELASGGTTSDAKEACSTDDALCHKCSEPNCNAVHCLKCDSEIDDECVEGDPDAVEYEVCSPEDKCLMFKDAQGYTKRGCTSNFDAPGVETTDPGNNFGLVPSEAIKCYQCNGNCDDVKDEQLKYCSRNDVLGCYYIDDGFSVTRRGCLSEEGLGCGNDQNCFDCADKDGCNAEKINECYHCTFDDPEGDCVSSGDAATCSTTGDCVVYINQEGKFVRGCENDIPPAESPKCAKTCHGGKCNDNDVCDATTDCNGICSLASAADKCLRYQNVDQVQTGCSEFRDEICGLNTEHCYACDQNLCNGKVVAECYTCPDCPIIEPQHSTQLCADISDKCYTVVDKDGLVLRGCLENMSPELTDAVICPEAACNNKPLSTGNSCYQCTVDCDTTDGLDPSPCSGTFEGCYTAQDLSDPNLSITRGCATDADFLEKCQQFNCIKCDDENCNTDPVPSEPLWCSTCSERECFDYTPPQECKEGILFDRCIEYVVFNTPIYKGCLSEGIPQVIQSDCYGERQFCGLCEGKFCNTPKLSCYECSSPSKDGYDCIASPDKLGMTTECGGHAYCYSRVDEGTGHLRRGCANDAISRCTEGPLCKTCQEHNCNDDMVPMDRLYCYQCEGVSCLTPLNSEPCPIYKDGQQCYTYAEDDSKVYRGCTDDTEPHLCDDKPCEFCKTRGCNDHETMVPNTWTCIQCSRNSECDGMAFGQRCTKDLLLGRSDSCYTQYHLPGVPIEKGCVSGLSESHPCMQDSPNCEICSEENDCNRGEALCYKCNSKTDDDCSEILNGSTLTECKGECMTLVDDYTERGCVEDFLVESVANCENSELCDVCQGKLCNDGMLPSTRLQCYVCEGSDCIDPSPALLRACARYDKTDQCYTSVESATWVQRGCLSSLVDKNCGEYCQPCQVKGCNNEKVMQPNTLSCVKCEDGDCVGKMEGSSCTSSLLLGRQDWCYTYQVGGTTSKGCLSDLKESDPIRDSCTSLEDEKCVICSNDNCNGEFPYCITCDSENDPTCGGYMAIVPDDVRTLCDDYKCVSYVDENGYTRKGCGDETTNCDGKELCAECTEPMCNNVAFPEGRILCHQCDDDCNEKPTGGPTPCQKYDSEDSCYVFVADESITRGCLSDEQIDCKQGTCLNCASNGCNDQPYQYSSSLSCIQCDNARNCASETEPAACGGLAILGEADECYSLVVNDEVIKKGCRSAFDDCNAEDCHTCSCSGCNLAIGHTITCAECDGEDCGNGITGGVTCQSSVACISFVSRDGIVSRGCIENFQDECSDFGSKHDTCFESNCNRNVYPEDRILCHRCTNCLEAVGNPEICPTYVEDDKCYTALSVDGTTVSRGCLSELLTPCNQPSCFPCGISECNNDNPFDPETTDPTTGETTDEVTDETADGTTDEITEEITDDTTGETTDDTPPPATLACLRCQESSENPSCTWGFQTSAAEQCPSEHATGCFTCRQDSLTVRGCSSDETKNSCTLEPETCSSDGCNNQNQRTQRCALGSSSSFTVKPCEGIVEYEKRGCYVLRSALGVITERGCYADLSEQEMRTCETDRNACYLCQEDGCNSGVLLRIMNGLIFTLVTLGFVRNVLL